MSCSDFARLVADMRAAQREYFRTRNGQAMERSKALEKQVDQATREILNTEPSLFDEKGA